MERKNPRAKQAPNLGSCSLRTKIGSRTTSLQKEKTTNLPRSSRDMHQLGRPNTQFQNQTSGRVVVWKTSNVLQSAEEAGVDILVDRRIVAAEDNHRDLGMIVEAAEG
ncbi:hypothetical protein PISMIDRAFT_683395 [Pisolithus microcarpus 441]|uniref:Uncharacterized protein n=1 Tax=Pisolithus microcarpus 441 TaxID=765257 RepID=A0A0C9Z9Q0_9AGAM|nr:hypothetical protein PISMIDRAFT_683395 [Pisolithus microcarpus 441]